MVKSFVTGTAGIVVVVVVVRVVVVVVVVLVVVIVDDKVVVAVLVVFGCLAYVNIRKAPATPPPARNAIAAIDAKTIAAILSLF